MPRRISSPELVGRARELAALGEAIAAAAAGEPSLALVAGEPGVGKSRLVAELRRRTGPDWISLRGDCLRLEDGEFPYAPIVAALREVPHGPHADIFSDLSRESRAELGRVLPGTGTPAAPDMWTDGYAPGRIHELLLRLLCHLSEARPVLLVIEDLHWSDRSTRDFLAYLAHNLRSERMAVVATYRTDIESGHPVQQLVGELVRLDGVECHRLEPLTLDGTARLLTGILGDPPDPRTLQRVYSRSGGNPYYTEELLAAGPAGLEGPVPPTIRDTQLARYAKLPEDAQQVIRLTAVIGRPASYELLAAADLSELALSSAVRGAVSAHLLAHDPVAGTIDFRHALTREVIYADLLPGERRMLHRCVANRLEAIASETPGEAVHPAELAHHWSVAGNRPAALAAAVDAGFAAARAHASIEAAEHFTRALGLWDSVDPSARPATTDRVELLAQAAEATRATGDIDGAMDYCRAALEALDPAAEPVRTAWFHERIGRYRAWDLAHSLKCYGEGLRILPPEPSPGRARLLADEGLALMLMVRWGEARDRCEQALRVAQAVGARAEEGYARTTLGLVLSHLGDAPAAEQHLEEALRIAEQSGRIEDLGRVHLHLAEVKRLGGRYSEAVDLMRSGIRVARLFGAEGAFGGFMAVNLADDLFLLGDWDAVESHVHELDAAPLVPTGELLRDALAGQLATARGQWDQARDRFERAERRREPGLPVEILPALGVGPAELALWERRYGDAREHVRSTLHAMGDAEDRLYTPALYSIGTRIEADAAAHGRLRGQRHVEAAHTRAAALNEALASLLSRHGAGTPPTADAHRRLAEAELLRARDEPAAEAWAAAAAAWEELSHPYPAAYARLREAESSMRTGVRARQRAQAALATAHGCASPLGAAPLLREIEAFARRARLDVEPRARESAVPVEAPAFRLTARELEVLKLIAQGLKNRQIGERLFISPHTAGVHASHIYEKLDVRDRVEAAGVAHRLGLLEDTSEP